MFYFYMLLYSLTGLGGAGDGNYKTPGDGGRGGSGGGSVLSAALGGLPGPAGLFGQCAGLPCFSDNRRGGAGGE